MAEGRDIARTKAEERERKLVLIRRRRRKQILIIATAVVVFLAGSIQLYRSGLFNIQKIDITGNTYLPTGNIVEACGVNKDSNLLTISTGAIKDRIIKNPWVKNVAIRRALPHTLRVEVDERVPVALISHAGKFYIIDEDLFVIAERKYADGANVPTITDLPIGKIKIGETIANDSLANAVKCLKSMDPSLKKTIVLISAPAVDKLSLYNKDNIEIFYGDAKQADDKNRVLETILKEQGRQVIFIDIRSYPHSDPVLRRIDSVP